MLKKKIFLSSQADALFIITKQKLQVMEEWDETAGGGTGFSHSPAHMP